MPRTRPLQNEESLGAMKKTKLTRSLLAACSIVALSAVMYGCTSDGSENDLVATEGDLEQEKMAHAATQDAQGYGRTRRRGDGRLTGELADRQRRTRPASNDHAGLTPTTIWVTPMPT